jgi:hypothetical protein
LDVTIRVEIHNNPSSKGGETQGYGFSIPALDASNAPADPVHHHRPHLHHKA